MNNLKRFTNVPEERDNYVDSYYNLLREVDRDLVHFSDIEDRPTNPEHGYTFFDVDNAILQRWDDNSGEWVTIGGLGSESNPIDRTLHIQSIEVEESQIPDNLTVETLEAEELTVTEQLLLNGKNVDTFTDQLQSDITDLESDVGDIEDDVNELQDTVITSNQKQWEIQKNGTDGEGIINFKTE